jgi:uncharacterized delta-60 repeat protein
MAKGVLRLGWKWLAVALRGSAGAVVACGDHLGGYVVTGSSPQEGGTDAASEAAATCTAGKLDTTFGTAGVATLDTAGAARAVVYQPDGKIVAAGGDTSLLMVRVQTDGTLDTTFGTAGKVTTTGEPAVALARQTDGRLIVLAGRTLLRFTADGALDTTFGTAGTVTTSFTGRRLAIGSDARILVLGTDATATGGLVLAAYGANGAADGTFGDAGSAPVDTGAGAKLCTLAGPSALASLSGGAAAVGFNLEGCTDSPAPSGQVLRIGATGTLAVRAQTSPALTAVGVDTSGAIFSATTTPAIERRNSQTLSQDTSFGGPDGGAVALGDQGVMVTTLAFDQAGRTLGVGGTYGGGTASAGAYVYRLTVAGAVDISFGTSGHLVVGTQTATGAAMQGCNLAVVGAQPGFSITRIDTCCNGQL